MAGMVGPLPETFAKMNLLEIIERYDNPETLAKLTEERIREIFTACSHAETPAGRIAQVFILNDPEKLQRVREVKHWAIDELKRRDIEAGEHSDLGTLPQEKIHLEKGRKADFFRVVDILWEMRFFKDANDGLMEKKRVFRLLSTVFNDNFENPDQDLSKAYQATREVNLKIFRDMTERMEQEHSKRQDKRDKY